MGNITLMRFFLYFFTKLFQYHKHLVRYLPKRWLAFRFELERFTIYRKGLYGVMANFLQQTNDEDLKALFQSRFVQHICCKSRLLID